MNSLLVVDSLRSASSRASEYWFKTDLFYETLPRTPRYTLTPASGAKRIKIFSP
ncbi:MAG: hypothetical protein RMZ41_031615 [Nostoc sp. DedVER02]|uniref:hypothetical protein n=1 Tax=unclassified Nostoc TaxID=2593658 RepID=UPI002AD3F63C|nr:MULTISPECIES: hypothetical protein [unclassified Nostoc]MDZ7988630.1 hypothetical protein [Nostoc sp. DedVER02]MDZ8113999.1 hypothetical protein [Nostoc sp. DedVER01b]